MQNEYMYLRSTKNESEFLVSRVHPRKQENTPLEPLSLKSRDLPKKDSEQTKGNTQRQNLVEEIWYTGKDYNVVAFFGTLLKPCSLF